MGSAKGGNRRDKTGEGVRDVAPKLRKITGSDYSKTHGGGVSGGMKGKGKGQGRKHKGHIGKKKMQ